MSDQKNQPAPTLSNAEKDTARRLGMTPGEYSSAKNELIKRGKIKG
jgi:hypothetical protein